MKGKKNKIPDAPGQGETETGGGLNALFVVFKCSGYEIHTRNVKGKWQFFKSLTRQWCDDLSEVHEFVFTNDMWKEFSNFKNTVKQIISAITICNPNTNGVVEIDVSQLRRNLRGD